MPDNAHTEARPWTPGPWTTHGRGEWIDVGPAPAAADCDSSVAVGIGRPNDAALIALAPEMAELILTISDADLSVYDDVPEAHDLMDALDVLAEKLRQIGADHA